MSNSNAGDSTAHEANKVQITVPMLHYITHISDTNAEVLDIMWDSKLEKRGKVTR